MDPSHLHLHVRDLGRSIRFYRSHFGLEERIRHGDIAFLGSPGFDLALREDPVPAALPDWFHFGFKLPSARAVRELHDRLRADGVPVVRPLVEEPGYATCSVSDPDGYRIEVYWE